MLITRIASPRLKILRTIVTTLIAALSDNIPQSGTPHKPRRYDDNRRIAPARILFDNNLPTSVVQRGVRPIPSRPPLHQSVQRQHVCAIERAMPSATFLNAEA